MKLLLKPGHNAQNYSPANSCRMTANRKEFLSEPLWAFAPRTAEGGCPYATITMPYANAPAAIVAKKFTT